MIGVVQKRQLIGLDERGQVTHFDEPLGEVGRGQVLVRIRASMISAGTQLRDIAQLRRTPRASSSAPPMALGYQAAGDVVQVGEGVDRLRPGQRVACFGVGAQHSDYGIVAQNLCFPIPDDLSYEEASGANLIATALHAVRRAEPQIGEFMLVVGLGIVGQLVAQFARAAGMYVMGWDTAKHRLRVANQHSADIAIDPGSDGTLDECARFTGGLGFDAATMAIGGDGTAALEQVKGVMKVSPDTHAMGRVVMVGGLKTVSSWGAGMGNLDLRSSARTGPGYHDDRWEVGDVEYPPVFMRWTTRTNIQLAFRMMVDGRLNLKPLITHRFPLAQAAEAVDSIVETDDPPLAVVLHSADE